MRSAGNRPRRRDHRDGQAAPARATRRHTRARQPGVRPVGNGDRHAAGHRLPVSTCSMPCRPPRSPRSSAGVPVVAERRATAPFAWIAALAFASGFPFGLINEALPVYLRSGGASLVDVGLVAAATFPWTFKFLWAPVLDRTGTRKQWIAGCLILLVLVIPLIARVDASQHAQVFFGLIVLAVTLSATQDVAIDAFTIQATPRRATWPRQLGAHRRLPYGDARVGWCHHLAGGAEGLARRLHGGNRRHGVAGGSGAFPAEHRPGAATGRPVTVAAAALAADTPGNQSGCWPSPCSSSWGTPRWTR